MPRDLPIGNGHLLINFDADHRIRDIYFPFVGKENHAGGHPFRFGIMVGNKFRWVGREYGWSIHSLYEPDTLVTQVQLTHPELGVSLCLRDAVDFLDYSNNRVLSRRHCLAFEGGREDSDEQ